MPHTAHADPHEPRTKAVAPEPRGTFRFREYPPRTFLVGTGFSVRAHAPTASVLVRAAPLRSRCWKSPRAGPRGAARTAEVPRGWGPHSTVSKGLERKRGLRC